MYSFLDIKEHCRLVERGELSKEPRFLARVLRLLLGTRKRLNDKVLTSVIRHILSSPLREKQREFLLGFVSTQEGVTEVQQYIRGKISVNERSFVSYGNGKVVFWSCHNQLFDQLGGAEAQEGFLSDWGARLRPHSCTTAWDKAGIAI